MQSGLSASFISYNFTNIDMIHFGLIFIVHHQYKRLNIIKFFLIVNKSDLNLYICVKNIDDYDYFIHILYLCVFMIIK